MISKYEAKEWFSTILVPSLDREVEIVKFFDSHDLLNTATMFLTLGRFDNFIINPTFEELKQIIGEM